MVRIAAPRPIPIYFQLTHWLSDGNFRSCLHLRHFVLIWPGCQTGRLTGQRIKSHKCKHHPTLTSIANGQSGPEWSTTIIRDSTSRPPLYGSSIHTTRAPATWKPPAMQPRTSKEMMLSTMWMMPVTKTTVRRQPSSCIFPHLDQM